MTLYIQNCLTECLIRISTKQEEFCITHKINNGDKCLKFWRLRNQSCTIRHRCRINIQSFPGYSKNKIENIQTREFLRMTGKNEDLKKLTSTIRSTRTGSQTVRLGRIWVNRRKRSAQFFKPCYHRILCITNFILDHSDRSNFAAFVYQLERAATVWGLCMFHRIHKTKLVDSSLYQKNGILRNIKQAWNVIVAKAKQTIRGQVSSILLTSFVGS